MAETGQPYAYTADDPLNAADPLGLRVIGSGPSLLAVFYEKVLENERNSYRWAQDTYGRNGFSAEDEVPRTVRGKSVPQVVRELQSGALDPDEIKVGVGTIDGATYIINTKSAMALASAGIPRSDWNVENQTNDEEAMARLRDQLAGNGGEGFLTPPRYTGGEPMPGSAEPIDVPGPGPEYGVPLTDGAVIAGEAAAGNIPDVPADDGD